MAFACSHIATHLISEDDRFMIYGPVIMNSEVLLHQLPTSQLFHLGIPQGRGVMRSLVQQSYPQIAEVSEITSKAIQYSLAANQVDCIAVDITKASLLSDYSISPIAQQDYISYVLVVRKDIVSTREFQDFIKSYNAFLQTMQENMSCILDIPQENIDAIRLTFLEL